MSTRNTEAQPRLNLSNLLRVMPPEVRILFDDYLLEQVTEIIALPSDDKRLSYVLNFCESVLKLKADERERQRRYAFWRFDKWMEFAVKISGILVFAGSLIYLSETNSELLRELCKSSVPYIGLGAGLGSAISLGRRAYRQFQQASHQSDTIPHPKIE